MLLQYLLFSTFVAVFVIFMQWYFKRKSRLAPLKTFPGTPPTFLIGNLNWVTRIYNKKMDYVPGVYIFERIVGSALLYQETGAYLFWFGLKPIVSVFRADIMEEILSNNVSLEKSFEYSFLHPWLGKGLLTSTGPKWRHRRKLLTPSFHFRILEDFLPVFNNQSLVLVRKLKSHVDRDFVDITPLIILCTLDIVCETVMGVHIGAQDGENSEYVGAIHNLADFFNQRTVRPWLWTDFLFRMTSIGRSFAKDLKILHSFTQKVIKEKKEKLLLNFDNQHSSEEVKDEYSNKKRKALMDLLLDLHVNDQNLNEEDIREEVDTFMFEGHDTTAMGIVFALYCLGLYPKVQENVIEEIDGIFGEDTDRPVTHDDVRNMKYLECTLKESQRLFPSVPIIGRKLDEDVTFEGLTIPNGTTIHCSIVCLHKDPKVYPNPEVFNPDRFLPENSLNRHPYAYIPFSAGPRNCIGQKFAMLEEKTIIINILRHFKLISLDPRDKFHLKIEFTLKPAQPVRLKFIPRR